VSDPVRIGILGCGGYAGFHARNLKALPGVAVAALCSRRAESCEGLIARRLADVPRPAVFTDPATIYREAELDGVAILTPHATHCALATQALDAGCDVLVEKPLCIRPEEGDALARRAAEAERRVVVGYNPPFTEAGRWLRAALAAECFGRVLMVSAWMTQPWHHLTAGSWRQDPAIAGAGQSGDSGAHVLAGLCWAIDRRWETVTAASADRGAAVDVDTVATIRFQGDVLASLAIGGEGGPDGGGAVFVCERGRIEVDPWKGEWLRTVDAEGKVDEPVRCGGEPAVDAAFVAAIRGEAPSPVDAAFGADQARLLAAIREAAGSGAPVST